MLDDPDSEFLEVPLSTYKIPFEDFSLASFPARYSLQMPLRRVYLQTRHAPVYFYTRSSLENLCSKLIPSKYEIIDIPDDFLLEAHGVSSHLGESRRI